MSSHADPSEGAQPPTQSAPSIEFCSQSTAPWGASDNQKVTAGSGNPKLSPSSNLGDSFHGDAGLSLKMAFAIPCLVYPLVMTKIAMENGPFIDGLLVYPLKMVIFHGELLVITRLGNCFCFNFPCLFIDQPVGQHLTTLRP